MSTETGLLKDWPAGGPPLVWKATGLGKGYSTVSIAGGRIYTLGAEKDSTFAIALNETDGKRIWSARLGRSEDPGGMGEGPRATPTIAGDLLFAVTDSGELVCLNTEKGQELWHKDYVKDFGGEIPHWGFAESPLVDGKKVVVTPGGSEGAIVALEKETGVVVWKSKGFTDRAHYASIIAAEPGGVRQYIQLTSASVAGVTAADGRLLWHAVRRGQTAVVPTPIYADGFVYVTSGYGVGCNLFRITSNGGKFSAEEVYANKVMVNHHGGAIKVGDFVYGFSDGKGWTCQDFKTGEAKWQERDKLGKGSLVYAEGRLYLRSESGRGTVALIEASPQGYKEHGRFDQPDRSSEHSWAHPVVANGKLYLRDQDALLCYDIHQ